MLLSADNGNIVFQGNTHGKGDKLIANAITFNTQGSSLGDSHGELTLRAGAGKEITFYDPIITVLNGSTALLTSVTLNKSHDGNDFSGIIRFDGSKVGEYLRLQRGENESEEAHQKRLEASRYSDIQGETFLEGGSLILTNDVIYGRKLAEVENDTSFTLNQGILDISHNSQLNATNFKFNQGIIEITSESKINANSFVVAGLPAIFRMDKSALIDVTSFTADSGLSFDVDYWSTNDLANVIIQADNASFSGVIGMHDGMDTYSDNKWANTLSFNLIDASNITDFQDQLSGIQSNSTNSSQVHDPYQYQGEWSYEWVGTQLIATWTPLGGIQDVNPELEGNIVSNSMKSSASNAKALSSAALANTNILRLKSELQNNFWMKGIGDFAYDDSSSGLDGYSYQGGGYATGADFKVTDESIVGVAFGQLIGYNKSEQYSAKIKQESMMGSLYGAQLQTLNKRNSLLWTLAGTYGTTENSMQTHYSDSQNSGGTWNNDAYFVEAQME